MSNAAPFCCGYNHDMAEPQTLRNAPITEAIIDFQVEIPTTVIISEALTEVETIVQAEYPVVQTQFSLTGEMNFDPEHAGVRQVGERQVNGRFYQTEDKLQIAQFRLDGFTFNRLAPYTDWNEVFPEAMRLWDIYRQAFTPNLISQLSVRFINHFVIPTSIDRLDDYFTAPVKIPEGLPRRVTNFLTRITLTEEESNVSTDITQALGQSSTEGSTLTLLDINSYRIFEDLDPQNREGIVSTLNELRNIKNRTFFGSITERTVGLYI